MHARFRQAIAAAAVVLLLAGCAATPSKPSAPGPVDVVVIGDSLIDSANHCPECTGFVEQAGDRVAKVLHRKVRTHLLIPLGVPEALSTVSDDAAARKLIAKAEVVVVQVGFNNVLPDPETGIGCGGSLSGGFTPWIRSTTPACLAEGVATYGDLYAKIFATIRHLRGKAATAFVLTTSINANSTPPDLSADGLLGITAQKDRPFVLKWELAASDRWYAMQVAEAKKAGFQVVDVFHAVNGADGTALWFPYTLDGAHPNQKGDDLYARELAKADLSMLTEG